MGQTEHKNIKIRSRKDLEAIRERTRPLLEVERGARIVVGMGRPRGPGRSMKPWRRRSADWGWRT